MNRHTSDSYKIELTEFVENAPLELPSWHHEFPPRWPRITFANPPISVLYPTRFRAAIPMKKRAPIAPADPVASRILTLRGQKVILDSDLATIYGVDEGPQSSRQTQCQAVSV